MARAVLTDPYHNFRYHVKATKAGAIDPLGPVSAGFTAVTMPEQTVEVAEYKEGTMVYRRKFPGDVTFAPITLSRGVVGNTSEFWTWLNQTAQGGEYRIDLEIHQFHRTDVPGEANYANLTAKRIIRCFECVPTRVKPGSDMESTSSDISIQELDIEVESFTVTNNLA